MNTPLSPDDADRVAEDHFASHYHDSRGRFHPVRVAALPRYGKIYYQVRWALPREPTDDEDGSYIGDGGFFVFLATGEIEQFGSGELIGAYGILRAHHGLARGVEPSGEALAEILASYSRDELNRHFKESLAR